MKSKTDIELWKLGEEIGDKNPEAWDGYSGIELYAHAFREGYRTCREEHEGELARIKAGAKS